MKHKTNIYEFVNNDFDDINLAISNLESMNDSGTTNYAIVCNNCNYYIANGNPAKKLLRVIAYWWFICYWK